MGPGAGGDPSLTCAQSRMRAGALMASALVVASAAGTAAFSASLVPGAGLKAGAAAMCPAAPLLAGLARSPLLPGAAAPLLRPALRDKHSPAGGVSLRMSAGDEDEDSEEEVVVTDQDTG